MSDGAAPRAVRGEIAVGLVALLVRLAALMELAKAPSFYVPIIDERSYDRLARQLLLGHSLDAPYFWQSTAYPIVLAVIYATTKGSVLAARLAQTLLGAVTAALTYRLGERVGNRKVAAIAGLTVALYGPLIFAEFELVATTWETLWAVALPLVALRVQATPRKRWLLLLGVMGGLSIATRATFAAYVIALAIWLAVFLGRERRDRRGVVTGLALFAGGLLAVLLPLAILNQDATGHFGVLPSSGGINLYIGNNPDRERTLQIRPGPEWDKLASLPPEHGAQTPYAKNAFFVERVVDYAKTHPVAFLAGLGEKTQELISSREIPRNLDVYAYRPDSTLLSLLTWRLGPFGFPFGVLFPLAVLGAALHWRRLSVPLRLLLIVYPLAIVLVFASARYRVPLVPVLAVAAALAIETLAEAIRTRQWAMLGGPGALVASAVLASSLPGPFAEERRDHRAEMLTLVANVHLEEGRLEKAEALLTEALARDPANKVAHSALGTALTQRGEYDGAALHFETALRLDPDYAEAHRGLGNLDVLTDKPERALSHYRQALATDPNDGPLLNNVGQLLHRSGDDDAAADALRRALSVDATPEAAITLARIEMDPAQPRLYDLGSATKLAQFATEATHLGRAEDVVVLAEAYVRRGQVDEARALVERAVAGARANGDTSAVESLASWQRVLAGR